MEKILKDTLGDCKFAASSVCKEKSSYETISNENAFIYDPPSEENRPVRLVSSTDEYQLAIKNTAQKNICVVKTDKCLFHNDVSKCDCILITDNCFFFVEIKDSKKAQRHTNRERAIEQLTATIDNLINQKIDISGFDSRKAIICFKSLGLHLTQASKNYNRAVFLEKYKIDLEEGNAIEF